MIDYFFRNRKIYIEIFQYIGRFILKFSSTSEKLHTFA